MEKEQTKEKKEKATTSVWATLSAINCNEHVEKKKSGNGVELTYLSWSWAWGILKSKYPDASYSVREWDGKPYLHDEELGYLVETSLTVDGVTQTMRLPVMDGANKAQKSHSYTYKTRQGERTVEAATMFDINTAIMRCLVKTMALFGLGIYIYAGEDLPEVEAIEQKKSIDEQNQRALEAIAEFNAVKNSEEYLVVREKNIDLLVGQAAVKSVIRAAQLKYKEVYKESINN